MKKGRTSGTVSGFVRESDLVRTVYIKRGWTKSQAIPLALEA